MLLRLQFALVSTKIFLLLLLFLMWLSCTCKALCSEAESLTEGELAVNKEKKLPENKCAASSYDHE